MPLLRKEPFIREKPPPDVKPDDFVFYCKISGEVFTDYEKFFERIILCNSLVWTCAYTGRHSLTFQEALDSERKAKDLLAAFPSKLQRPLLCVAMWTHRARLDDVNQDVFGFSKDRYFKGEAVDIVVNNQKKSGTIIDVLCSSAANSADPAAYRYVVQEAGSQPPLIYNLESFKVGRRRGTFQRDRCKLFLKHYCQLDVDGIWKVKGKYQKQFRLSEGKFIDICGGYPPAFEKSVAKKKPRVVANEGPESGEDEAIKQAKELKKRKAVEKPVETESPAAKKARLDREEIKRIEEEIKATRERQRQDKEAAKQAKKDEMKRKVEEEKEKRKEEKAKQKEEKRRQEVLMREWNKIREDLECEDLKDLPRPQPIQCAVPDDVIGDVMALLEFLTCFKLLFDFDLPPELSFATLTKALAGNELDGLYFELLRQLLSAIFRLQEDEEGIETEEPDGKTEIADKLHGVTESCRELVRSATVASQRPILNFGTSLENLQVDSYTVSEIVRLHLMASGGERSQSNARFDYQQRGGYTSADDPALDFKRQEAAILKTLGEHNIFDLTPGEKAKVLSVLMNQLLTFAACRDHIDECCDKLRQAQRDLRAHQYAELKRERDEAQFWWRKKMESNAAAGENGTDPSSATASSASTPRAYEEKESKKKNGRKKKGFPTDKEYENMPLENLDWEKITTEEREHMKAWGRRKEKALVEQASELQFCTAICPLGRDRTFRRYWVFRSIPGLFVEDNEYYVSNDFFVPVDQKPSPFAPESCDLKSNSSDKENAQLESSDGSVDSKAGAANQMKEEPVEAAQVDSTKPVQTIHEQIATRNSVRWSVFVSPADVDRLIESLNPRGIREGALRQIVSEQRMQISECIARCSVSSFSDKSVPTALATQQKFGAEPCGVAEQKIEEILRESLLDIEERIFTGNLGMLKVSDRDLWRIAVSEFRYDPQCTSLTFADSQTVSVPPSDDKPVVADGNGDEVTCNNADGDRFKSTVQTLAMALLQIEQMIDAKYVNPPLGDDEEVKKQKQKALVEAAFKIMMQGGQSQKSNEDKDDDDSQDSINDEGNEADNAESEGCNERQLSAIERWEKSLMASTSLPQVWLHYTVLESSIAWSRSSLHARCRICRRKGDGERMLLCDACDRGHHMYCLKPPVKTIPLGNWFCPSCRPKEVVHAPRTPRKSFTETDIFDDEADDNSVMDDTANSVSKELVDNSVANTEVDEELEDIADSETATEAEETAADEDIDEDDEDDNYTPPGQPKIKLPRASKKRSVPASRSSTPSIEVNSCRSDQGTLSGKRIPKPKIPFDSPSVTDSLGSTSRASRTRRSVDVHSNGAGTPANSETGTRRKLVTGWDDYEVDSKRLSLTTKSRYSDGENNLKNCEELVKELMHQDDAWPFLKPVTKKEAVDYFDVIKNPMDFARIRNKINRFEYNTAEEILHDIRLIFSNCSLYNKPATIVAIAGNNLEKFFETRLQELNLVEVNKPNVVETSARGGTKNSRKRTM